MNLDPSTNKPNTNFITRLFGPITAYICPFCGKYFRTQNRHICKKDIKTKSCATCENAKLQYRVFFNKKKSWFFCEKFEKFCWEIASNKDHYEIKNEQRKFIIDCPHYK